MAEYAANELYRLCYGLDSCNARDRKKNIDRIKNLIKRSDVQTKITSHSSTKQKDNITWNLLLKCSIKSTGTDMDTMFKTAVKCQANGSQLPPTLSQSRKQEAVSLLKLVLRLGNRYNVFLDLNQVIEHSLVVLDNRTKLFEQEYCILIQKWVLTNAENRCNISEDSWTRLTEFALRRMKRIDSADNPLLFQYTSFLNSLINAMSVYYAPDLHSIIKIVTKCFENRPGSIPLIGMMLRILNRLFELYVIDCRVTLVQFGLSIRSVLERCWGGITLGVNGGDLPSDTKFASSQSDDSSNSEMTVSSCHREITIHWRYMIQLLIQFHKDETEESRAYIGGVCDCVRSEISGYVKRLHYFERKKTILSEDFYQLVVAIVFKSKHLSDFIDSTVTLPWQICAEKIKLATWESLPWINIAYLALRDFDGKIPPNEMLPLLQSLSACLSTSKKPAIKSQILNFVSSLSDYLRGLPPPELHNPQLVSVLHSLWKESFKALYVQQCCAEACSCLVNLLCTQFSRHLVNQEFWTSVTFLPVSESIVRLVAASLLHSDSSLTDHIRFNILHWIFPDREETGLNPSDSRLMSLSLQNGIKCSTYLLLMKALGHKQCPLIDRAHSIQDCECALSCELFVSSPEEKSPTTMSSLSSLLNQLELMEILPHKLVTNDPRDTRGVALVCQSLEVIQRELSSTVQQEILFHSSQMETAPDQRIVYLMKLVALLFQQDVGHYKSRLSDDWKNIVNSVFNSAISILKQKDFKKDIRLYQDLLTIFIFIVKTKSIVELSAIFDIGNSLTELLNFCGGILSTNSSSSSDSTNNSATAGTQRPSLSLDFDDDLLPVENSQNNGLEDGMEEFSEDVSVSRKNHRLVNDLSLRLLCQFSASLSSSENIAWHHLLTFLSSSDYTRESDVFVLVDVVRILSDNPSLYRCYQSEEKEREESGAVTTLCDSLFNAFRLSLKTHRRRYHLCLNLLRSLHQFIVTFRGTVCDDAALQLVKAVWKMNDGLFSCSSDYDAQLCQISLALIESDASQSGKFCEDFMKLLTRELFASRSVAVQSISRLIQLNPQLLLESDLVSLLSTATSKLLLSSSEHADNPLLIEDIWRSRTSSLLQMWAGVLTPLVHYPTCVLQRVEERESHISLIQMLYQFINKAKDNSLEEDRIAAIIDHLSNQISLKIGAPQTVANHSQLFLHSAIPKLVQYWRSNHDDFNSFPFKAFGLSDVACLLGVSKARSIFDHVLNNRPNRITQLAALLNQSEKELVRECLAPALSAHVILSVEDKNQSNETSLFDTHFDIDFKQLSAEIRQIHPHIVHWIVLHFTENKAVYHNCLETAVSFVFTALQSKNLKDVGFSLDERTLESVVVMSLSQLHYSLDAWEHANNVFSFGSIISTLLTHYLHNVTKNSSFYIRLLAIQVIRLLNREKNADCIGYFLFVVNKLILCMKTIECCVESHNVLVYGLLAVYRSLGEGTHSTNHEKISLCLQELLDMDNTSSNWIQAVQLLDPFPECFSKLETIRESSLKSSEKDGNLTEIERFVKTLDPRMTSLRLNRSHGLRKLADILEILNPSTIITDQAYQNVLGQLFYALLIYRDQMDEHRDIIADCFALLSNLVADLSEVSDSVLLRYEHCSWPYICPEDRQAMPDPATSLIHMKAVLRVSDCLVTDESQVLLKSSETLWSVMRLGQIHDHLKHLPNRDFYISRYLHPYYQQTKKSKFMHNSHFSEERFIDFLLLLDVNHAIFSGGFPAWIQCIVSTLIQSNLSDDPVLNAFLEMARLKIDIAELIFPALMTNSWFLCKSGGLRSRFDDCVMNVMRLPADYPQHCSSLLNYLENRQQRILHLCKNNPNQIPELNVTRCDPVTVASAALKLNRFKTAIYFLELGYSNDAQVIQRKDAQNILVESFKKLSDLNALLGCQAVFPTCASTRLTIYEEEKSWQKLILYHDTNRNLDEVAKSVCNLGAWNHFIQLTSTKERSVQSDCDAKLRNARYACAWRLSDWSACEDAQSGLCAADNESRFDPVVYKSLSSVRQSSCNIALTEIRTEKRILLQQLLSTSIGRVSDLTLLATQMECLRELELNLSAPNGRFIEQLTNIFGEKGEMDALDCSVPSVYRHYKDFASKEPCLTMRCSLLEELSLESPSLKTLCIQSQLALASLARQANKFQLSFNMLNRCTRVMDTLCSTPGQDMAKRLFELQKDFLTSQCHWHQNETQTALHLIKETDMKIEGLRSNMDGEERSQAYLRLVDFHIACVATQSDWLAQSKLKSASVITEYLQPLLDLAGERNRPCVLAFATLGHYSDERYKALTEYMTSQEFEARQNLMKQAKEDVNCLNEIGFSSRFTVTLARQSSIDEKQLTNLLQDREQFLLSAMAAYIHCLQNSENYDLKVFRLISLWLSNSNNGDICCLMSNCLSTLRVDKFLCLAPQLAARLSKNPSHEHQDFQPALQKLIHNLVQTHPYHAAYVLLALVHAKRDDDFSPECKESEPPKKRSKKGSSENEPITTVEDRILAAKSILNDLLRGKRAAVLQGMIKLSDAYIQWANFNVDNHRQQKGDLKYPSGCYLVRLSDLSELQIPTEDLPVDPSGRYPSERIVSLVKFLPKYRLAGGINLPKIVFVLGSDGVVRRQLVKGRDDLRQDAVMQQVFHTVNSLLSNTRPRMSIRTYKILPMSQRSGILQWCEGTVPIGDYLAGDKGGAHTRYRPTDMQPKMAKKKLYEVKDKSADIRLKTFKEITDKMKPVLHHFFFEHFLDIVEWHKTRDAYTRSVATNSMIGYILGLGDRHLSNILIDQSTAELVHIDLGVAFDQGHILPTPEMVPFRLSRDIVDGMGALNVEGNFRQSCIETLKTLREEHSVITTIVEVLLHDPLYTWTLSPQKAYLLQAKRAERTHDLSLSNNTTFDNLPDLSRSISRRNSDSTEVNKLAERVLIVLRRKLEGRESGSQLNVEGQVSYLIEEARDINNLGRMYFGWQAYL